MTDRTKEAIRLEPRASYPKEPRRLHENAWFYEEPGGLRVVQELREPKGDKYIGTATVLIPWRMIGAAYENRLKIKEQRKWGGRKLKGSKP